MFNKIIKRGHRKGSKSIPNGNVTMNHSSVASLDSSPVNLSPSRPAVPKAVIESLPLFRDVSSPERLNLFIRKTHLCCVLCDFNDNSKLGMDKEIKRKTLQELVKFIQSDSSKINEAMLDSLIMMISVNIFRCLPPASHENTGSLIDIMDPEDEDPWMDPAWPHLQYVYELLLRYIVSAEKDTELAKRYINHTFVLKLIDLFDSEDPREREFLKMVLHRIYAKFMAYRPFIRCAINNVFCRFIYETGRHSGIAELLEILRSIINGFVSPMKLEHKFFLVRALLPLHKVKHISIYHQQLTYCVTQFVDKDYKLAEIVIRGLLKYWPVINSEKEILFLGELEEVLDLTRPAEFRQCMVPLFRQIGRCLNSPHYQVAERALSLWNNEHMVELIADNRNVILPIIFESLEKSMQTHWNQTIHGFTANVQTMFLEMDADFFEECQRQLEEKEAKADEVEEQRELMWKRLEEVAAQSGGAGMVLVN